MEPRPDGVPYRRTGYKGGTGMWLWVLHRGSGLAVLAFLFLHILDTSLVTFGPKVYNTMAGIYGIWFFRPLEVVLMFLVIFHAFNGLRVILVDFWSAGARHQVGLSRAVMVITIVLFLPSAFIMLRPIFQ